MHGELVTIEVKLVFIVFSFFFFAKIDRPHTVVIQYVFSQWNNLLVHFQKIFSSCALFQQEYKEI